MRNQKCIRKTISEDTGIKSFLDMIAPSVVKFNPDHFICGNTFRCVWALREYPTQTDEQALLRHLGEKDGITLRIYTRQLTPVEEDRIIQNATNKNRMGSSNTNDLRQTVTAESNLQDVASLIASMHRNREPLFHCAVYLELTAPDYDALKLLQTDVLMLMYGREAQSKTRIASPATIPKSGERNRKIHSCMLYLISI